MNYVLVSIRDRQLNAFGNVWQAPTTGAAVRAFKNEVNTKGTPPNTNPEDYSLHQVGIFNAETGEVQRVDSTAHIALATELLKQGE